MPEAYTAVDSVSEIQLWFTEVPAMRTTLIRVLNGADVQVPAGEVVQNPMNGRNFRMALSYRLPAGEYTVNWEARGPDGHLVRDFFPFSVKEPL